MPETNSNRTLMALLASDGEEPDEIPAKREGAGRLPSLDERADMFLRAVHGAQADATAEQRAAARGRILAAMAADLAEETTDLGAQQNAAPSAARAPPAALAGRAAADRPQLRGKLVDFAARLLWPAGEVFAIRAIRMAAVPLLALLIVGSIWSGIWIGEESRTEPGRAPPPATSGRDATAPTTRSLTSPAERDLKRDIAAAELARGPMHPDVANKMVDLADLYRAQGRYGEAENLYDRALTIQRKALGESHPDVMRTVRGLAQVYRAEGRLDEANDLLRRADQR
jgi:tetratricopeptide (TPR) repeat protein